MELPLTFLKGKLTKLSAGIPALIDFAQQLFAILQGQEAQSFIVHVDGAFGSIAIMAAEAGVAWGSIRAAFNYGGR